MEYTIKTQDKDTITILENKVILREDLEKELESLYYDIDSYNREIDKRNIRISEIKKMTDNAAKLILPIK